MKRATTVVALALAVLSAGCSSGGGESPTLPPITATPTVSATPSATVSATPSATASLRAFPDTPQGAAAFARFLHGEIDRAYDNKDPEIVRPYFDAECGACARYLNTLTRLSSGIVTVERGNSTLLSSESPALPGDRTVLIREKTDVVVFRDQAGNVTASEPAGEYASELTLRRSGASFLLSEQTSR